MDGEKSVETEKKHEVDPDNDYIIAILVAIIMKTRECSGDTNTAPMIWRVKQLLKKTLKAVDRVGPFTLPIETKTPNVWDWDN